MDYANYYKLLSETIDKLTKINLHPLIIGNNNSLSEQHAIIFDIQYTIINIIKMIMHNECSCILYSVYLHITFLFVTVTFLLLSFHFFSNELIILSQRKKLQYKQTASKNNKHKLQLIVLYFQISAIIKWWPSKIISWTWMHSSIIVILFIGK